MLVDDDKLDLIALQRAFSDHNLISCTDSKTALEAHCDIAIIDLIMSGIDIAKKIREKKPKTKIVMHTALNSGGHYLEACAIADRVAEKSVDMSEIKSAVRSLL